MEKLLATGGRDDDDDHDDDHDDDDDEDDDDDDDDDHDHDDHDDHDDDDHEEEEQEQDADDASDDTSDDDPVPTAWCFFTSRAKVMKLLQRVTSLQTTSTFVTGQAATTGRSFSCCMLLLYICQVCM